MKILALEASSQCALAALEAENDSLAQPRAVFALEEPRALSRSLVAAIDAVIRRADWTLDDIEALAVGIGPGSWTSLRVALSTAKTLAQARGWRLAGIPTFDAMAASIWRAGSSDLPGHFLLLTTARSRPGELYGKIYLATREGLALIQPEWVGAPQTLADTLGVEEMARGLEAPFVLVGEGAEEVSAILEQNGDAHLVVTLPVELLTIEIARAAQIIWENEDDANPLELQPLYVAPSAAERSLAAKSLAEPSAP